MFGLFSRTKKYNNLNARDFKNGLESSDSLLIDVRGPNEIKQGAIPGHKMINVSKPTFKEEVRKLDKSKSYFLYCRSGMRSAHACRIMYDMGFKNLNNLRGGIMAWNRSNR